ncbi:MAG: TIGR02391 family protein [Clostridia bacterium]|nr:TIGR02391 family protein [Clostridia bacterium]
MEENLKLLIDRIDSLTYLCDNDKHYAYDKIKFELDALLISVLGKDSSEYLYFISICKSSRLDSEKAHLLRGILGAVRNKLLIEGIKISTTSNWDELLHPIIYKTSYKKLNDGYYAESVEAAIKEINVRIKNLYKKYKSKELDGADLFANAFNSDKDKTLLMAGTDLESQSGKDEQEGYRLLFMGLWKGIRNPKAHANTSLTKEQAIERLIFTSMLMNKLDECIRNAGLIE